MKVTIAQLQKWYTEYNALVFSNSLPTMMPFELTNTRSYLGRACWRRRSGIYSYTIKVSNYFDCKEDDFRAILVHEMCHIYCFVNEWFKDGHKGRWKTIAAKASAITGFNIARTTSITGWEVAEENKAKEERRMARKAAASFIVEVRKEGDDRHFLLKTTENVIDKNLAFYPNNGWCIAGIYISNNPIFKTWTIRRCLHWGKFFDDATYQRVYKPILETADQMQILSARRSSVAR